MWCKVSSLLRVTVGLYANKEDSLTGCGFQRIVIDLVDVTLDSENVVEYPLVHVCIAMENQHFEWANH